jgi:hypothetical protein
MHCRSEKQFMLPTARESSLIARFFWPLIPIGVACFGVWILISGRYIYRPGRSHTVFELIAPDAYLIGVFYLFLAALLSAFGVTGRKEKWFFWVGVIGSATTIAIESARQLLGLAAYG